MPSNGEFPGYKPQPRLVHTWSNSPSTLGRFVLVVRTCVPEVPHGAVPQWRWRGARGGHMGLCPRHHTGPQLSSGRHMGPRGAGIGRQKHTPAWIGRRCTARIRHYPCLFCLLASEGLIEIILDLVHVIGALRVAQGDQAAPLWRIHDPEKKPGKSDLSSWLKRSEQ